MQRHRSLLNSANCRRLCVTQPKAQQVILKWGSHPFKTAPSTLPTCSENKNVESTAQKPVRSSLPPITEIHNPTDLHPREVGPISKISQVACMLP